MSDQIIADGKLVSLSDGSEIAGTLMGRVRVLKPDVGVIEIAIAIGFDTT